MRLIDADILLEQMKRRKEYIGRPSDPVCLVEDAQTVDAMLIKHANWICVGIIYDNMYDCEVYHCSNCESGKIITDTPTAYNFCPNCGAKMDGEIV